MNAIILRSIKVDNELEERFRWASTPLAKAGYVLWGWSPTHGRSKYYIKAGDESRGFNDQIRIRVSDHFANSERYDLDRRTFMDFQVDLDPADTLDEVVKQVEEAIRERERFLLSDDYQAFCEREAESGGGRWNRELQCTEP
jgi:hypothetical protein